MSYNDDDFEQVVEVGEYVRPEQLNGHLVIVYPVGYHDYFPTRFTQSGKKSDALCCDVIDLDDKNPEGQPGKVYRASNFLQAQLILGLRPFIGKKSLGRIGKGISKTGLNPPWVLTDMSTDQVALERAKAWRAANPNFSPSPFIPRQADPLAGQAPPQQPAQPTAPLTQQEAYELQRQLASPPQQPAPQSSSPPAAAPVPGSAQLSTEELSMLQRMRMERAQREAAANPFEDQPPF